MVGKAISNESIFIFYLTQKRIKYLFGSIKLILNKMKGTVKWQGALLA